ncbi:hypothetical protein V6N13_081158 [Hibiscus sabdariffa]
MDGLQQWAKTELKRRGVQNLTDAIAVAESLIDYTSRKESTSKPKDKKSGQAKGGGDTGQRKVGHQDDNPSKYKESSTWKGKAKAKDFRGSKRPSSNKCFICDGELENGLNRWGNLVALWVLVRWSFELVARCRWELMARDGDGGYVSEIFYGVVWWLCEAC